MNASHRTSTLEFLEFLADISNPATGEISTGTLASRLYMTEADLLQRWMSRGDNVSWRLFADELLAVLDAVQDVTYDLTRTIRWYRSEPIEIFDGRTADEVVTSGEARRLVLLIKRNMVQIH
jgi:hypothetical protein